MEAFTTFGRKFTSPDLIPFKIINSLIIQDTVNSLEVPKTYAISIDWLILLENNITRS